MHTLLLQSTLDPREVVTLYREFPHYRILALDAKHSSLSEAEWSRIEILFGKHLSVDQLEHAKQLRWIQVPNANLKGLCLPEIFKRENILVTFTPEEDLYQRGEYVIAAVFALAKRFPNWKKGVGGVESEGDSVWTHSLWTLKDCTLLQIGLGDVGTEVARQAQRVGLRVIGAQSKATFHPHCQETISYRDIPLMLPQADIVSICLPQKDLRPNFFSRREFELMKQDAILIVLESEAALDRAALLATAKSGRLRGVVLDLSQPFSPQDPLWQEPLIWITPGIAALPHRPVHQAFHIFHFNLRQYKTGNFADLRYRLAPPQSSGAGSA